MKIIGNSIIVLLLLFVLIPASLFAKSSCEVRDISGAKSEKEIELLRLTGNQWMQKAKVCQVGEYVIATPESNTKNDKKTLLILRDGKPVFYRHNGGTYIYSPNLEDAAFDKVLVHLWHNKDDGKVKRIWYQTVGNDPEVQVYDKNFDGLPDTRTL